MVSLGVSHLCGGLTPPLLDSGLRRNDDPEDFWDSEALSKPRNIIFEPIAHAGCRRHTKVCKAGVVAWYGELALRILPRPSSAPAGDKPLASRSLRPHYIPHPRPFWIPAFAGMTIRQISGTPKHFRNRVTSFSNQSLMPVATGTPRYEMLEL